MKYIKKLIRNSKRALNQQVIKKKQEIVKYAPRLTGIQGESRAFLRLGFFVETLLSTGTRLKQTTLLRI